jgi:hypothetical protein
VLPRLSLPLPFSTTLFSPFCFFLFSFSSTAIPPDLIGFLDLFASKSNLVFFINYVHLRYCSPFSQQPFFWLPTFMHQSAGHTRCVSHKCGHVSDIIAGTTPVHQIHSSTCGIVDLVSMLPLGVWCFTFFFFFFLFMYFRFRS